MDKSVCRAVLMAFVLIAGISVGCGPKNPPASVSQFDTNSLPGTAEVKAALEKKDYEGAVAAYLKINQSVATEEQHAQLMDLSRELRLKLSEAAPTDPKAAEALKAVGVMTTGR